MLTDIFRNNILYLLKERNKTMQDLQKIVGLEEIPLLGMLDGKIMLTVKTVLDLSEFFGMETHKLYEPLTNKEFDLFENIFLREEFEEKLENWLENRRNQRSSLMSKKGERKNKE